MGDPILKRIRTTRGLEEAIEVRLDVRWLCSGQSIDHTTISLFRVTHKELIKELFFPGRPYRPTGWTTYP